MKALRIVALSGAVLVLVFGIVAYLGVTGFEGWMCGATVVRRVPSPDGRLEAVLYERSCGATTDFGTSLSVIRAGGKVRNHVGNLLVADSDHGLAPLDSGNVIRLSLQWIGSHSLVVRYDRRARVFQQHPNANGVSVRYIPVDERGA